MQILKPGRIQTGWSKEMVCSGYGNGGGGCGAQLLVEQDDVFGTESHHYDGSSEYYATFKCPCCYVWTDIQGEVPFKPRRKNSYDRSGVNTDWR